MQYSELTALEFERTCEECHKKVPSNAFMYNFVIAGKSIDICKDCAQVTAEEDEITGEQIFVLKIKKTYERAHLVKDLKDVKLDSDLAYLGYKCICNLPQSGISKYEEMIGNFFAYERLWVWRKDNDIVITYDQGNSWCNVESVTDYDTYKNGEIDLKITLCL